MTLPAMPARRFTQVDLFASDAAKAVTPSRGEDPRTPHIKQFSDGYRVWNPMVRNYVGDAHMQPFRDVGAASVLQRALYMEMAASGTAPAKVMRKAEAMRAEGSDLFGASAAVRPTGEQRGFKFNGAMAASKANPFVVVGKRGRREIPAVFTSRKEAGLARGYLEAAEGARGLRVRATTPAERARKRNGASRVPPPRSLIHVEILAGGYGGTTDPTARITRFTAVTPLEGYGKKARSHRFPIDELVARAAGGRVVLDGKKVVGVVFTNADRNDSGASVATRAVAALAQELYGDPTVLRAQVDYAKRNDVRRSRAPEPSFDPYAYGRPIYAEEARPAKPSRRSAEDYEAISMLKPNGVTRKRNGMDFSYASEPIIDEDGRVDPTDVRWVVRDESGDIDASFNDHSYGRGVPGYQPEKWARLWASLRNAGHGREQTREKVREVWAVDAAETQRWLAERRKSNPGRTLPATVERCVAHVGPRRVEELGEREGLSSAIAICTAQGQRTGQLRKGTRTPTKKGRRDQRNARRRVGFAEDERAVERMVKAARKGNGRSAGGGAGAVFVYRNLHTGTWSVKALRGPSKGRVIGHPDDVTVADVEFRVNAAGRDRVRAECVKGVHAGVVGTIDAAGIPADYPAHLIVEVGYNPFLFDSFVLLANRVPLHRAAFVRMPPQPRGGARPLIAALYPEDAHLLDAPPVAVDGDRAARMRECRERNAKRGARRRG